ncbi:uroplakin-3b-like protein 2 isoform X2 [Tachyglossus aculeatus]|uniref:uroplakin-3b-like protein 2 isoform X2 n=1 Tax=Tachyglossus aculeatus TaxID=9261 RepID=UPI0018F3A91F|nr:uroplakin-3b-like protein 2 isoform X2 [Tachyglossus aculeatus]
MQEKIPYTPVITTRPLEGKLTGSTFTLDQPLGRFNSSAIDDLDDIWLVVAYSNATDNFSNPANPEEVTYFSDLAEKQYYMTMRATRDLYPGGGNSSILSVLRVGQELNCNSGPCNSPLTWPGPYRVKFLVMNDSGPVAETEWSDNITLKEAEEPGDPGPARRGPGMIVITTILSVLFALLLGALASVLIQACFSSSGSTDISRPRNSERVRNYVTHHMYSRSETENN